MRNNKKEDFYMKKTGKRVTALSVGVMLMMNMAATTVPVSAEGESKVYTHDGYTVEYTVKNEWTGNQNIEVTITNTGSEVMCDWAVGYNAFGEIGGLWNAQVYGHQGTEYILKGASYNSEIEPGQSANFGYTLTGDKFKIPQNIVNCAERVDITEGYNVYYNITNDYESTYQAEMIIENTSDTDISAWQLSFDGNVTIDDLWSGKLIENNNGSFKVKNAENNSVIAAGSSVSFNFSGSKNGQAVPDISEPIETLPIVVTEEFSETETSFETEVVNPETDLTENSMADVETETTEVTVETEITTVTEPVVNPVSEVVFSNYKLTGVVIPMEFDFEIDPEVDSDNDGLPDYLEKEIGTDRYNADTDSDGLPDGYEYYTLRTDPAKADTNDNGISDADEDFDEDGLTNLEEYELGTDPFSKDTDNDGLSDYDEVKIHNTDPLKYDTDSDKVSDGDEVILGLDPNNPATYGYPDSEYTTEQTLDVDSSVLDYINNIEDNPYTITVDITAAGVAENNLSAGESGYSHQILQNDAVLGVVPELAYTDGLSVTDVVVNFNLDDSAVEGGLGIFDEDGIERYGIFMYFEDTNTLLPIETAYDETTNSLSAHVDKVGTLCVVDIEKWLNNLNENSDEPYYLEDDTVNEPANIAFCLDSRSIADADSLASIKEDVKAVTKDAFERYTKVKIYIYYQQFGIDFKVKNNLLSDEKTGNNYFTNYDDAVNALDKFENIENDSWMYDFAEASKFIIDACDENIVAMYHITDNERIMGSISEAKELTYTVLNSKYTTTNNNEINRIYISLICPNSQNINADSYAYQLVEASNGVIYTGSNEVNIEESEIVPLTYSAMSNESSQSNPKIKFNGRVDTIIRKNVDIWGEGRDPKFFLLLTPTGLKDIRLRTTLKRGNLTDTDNDGKTDWSEVDIKTLQILTHKSTGEITELRYNNTPDFLSYAIFYASSGNEEIKKGIDKVKEQAEKYFGLDFEKEVRILPIISDPTMTDSDGDGITDGPKLMNGAKYTDDELPLKYSFKYYNEELYPIYLEHPKWKFNFKCFDITLDDLTDYEYNYCNSYSCPSTVNASDTYAIEVGTDLFNKRLDEIIDYNKKIPNGISDRNVLSIRVQDSNNTLITRDGLEYYLNPKTYLTEDNIFVFLSLKKHPDIINHQLFSDILTNTYFDTGVCGTSKEDFVDFFCNMQVDIDPYYIYVKTRIENGTGQDHEDINRYSNYIDGSINKYVFGGLNANNGSAYEDTINLSPDDWITPIKGLNGLAEFTKQSYYDKGQTTPYFMRFDVNSAVSFTDPRQYSTSTDVVLTQGVTYYKRIIKNSFYRDGELTFFIPVFEDIWKNK